MLDTTLEPTDYCGCGDIGYLITRSLPIDLAHGLGKINKVPVYHCRTESCPEYMIPSNVTRRLDELAEKMETLNSSEIDFSWETDTDTDTDTTESGNNNELAYLHAFLLQLDNRVYEDAKVILIIPEQAVIFQGLLDHTEYHILQYEPEQNSSGIWLSLSKFYYEKKDLTYQDFLNLAESDLIKQLGVFTYQETEVVLEELFGDIV
jgi:hypothetical protein